ncbi:MAG TPA: flagellar motor protein [Acidobacteriaceae bacterium]|nr:flagellar motor protein [Terriglobia bacterium]HVC91204.1 flagellar motor protein [Acidobacteriaceae bacterium]
MDKSSFGGILLAIGGILTGMMLEGGKIGQILQPTAAMIVFGGTFGAVMVQFPLATVVSAVKNLAMVFFSKEPDGEAVVRQLVMFANKARRSGIVSLDQDLDSVPDPFMKQALMLAVDGTDPAELRKIMQLYLDTRGEAEERIPQVFESAGGFSPTIGIIGAILGLIQVMQHLDNIAEVGRGIAVAFVATIYGLGLANIICLPSAGKLKIRFREEHLHKELMLEGVIAILEGMNPRMVELKLKTFLAEQQEVPEGVQT